MEDRVEFRRDAWHIFSVGMGYIAVSALLIVWYWWVPVLVRGDGSRSHQLGLVFAGLIAIGFGIWELLKLFDGRVKVVVDRDGITDLRAWDVRVPWSAVERIDQIPLRQALRSGEIRGLRLVMQADPTGCAPRPRHEMLIWEGGLTGGTMDLRQAIAQMAPQVPREW
jgi:hypothetical protein